VGKGFLFRTHAVPLAAQPRCSVHPAQPHCLLPTGRHLPAVRACTHPRTTAAGTIAPPELGGIAGVQQRLRSARHAMQRARAGDLAAVSASRQARPTSYWSHTAHVAYRKHSAADTAAYPARLENLLRLRRDHVDRADLSRRRQTVFNSRRHDRSIPPTAQPNPLGSVLWAPSDQGRPVPLWRRSHLLLAQVGLRSAQLSALHRCVRAAVRPVSECATKAKRRRIDASPRHVPWATPLGHSVA
jgi:hypothetical protein